jgi:hypothetical protein
MGNHELFLQATQLICRNEQLGQKVVPFGNHLTLPLDYLGLHLPNCSELKECLK